MATRKLTINRPDWQAWTDTLTDRVPFETGGSLRGVVYHGSYAYGGPPTGRMSYMHAALLRENQPEYVIYSYGTPIAWHSTRYGWCVPDATYSVTTAKQLGRVRTALSMIDADVFVA